MRCDDIQGFLLHSKPYSETSLIVDLLTRQHGRVRCIAKGFRKASKKGVSRVIFPYLEYAFSWYGRSELKTLTRAEATLTPTFLRQDALYTGLYVNELVYRLLQEQESSEDFYRQYRDFLASLCTALPHESRLRMLEMSLLEELGYGLVLDADAESGEQIIAQHYYRYVPQLGLQRLTTNHRGDALLGQHLLSLVAGDWQQQEVLQVARVVLRTAIDFYLDGRLLHSRRLYRQYRAAAVADCTD